MLTVRLTYSSRKAILGLGFKLTTVTSAANRYPPSHFARTTPAGSDSRQFVRRYRSFELCSLPPQGEPDSQGPQTGSLLSQRAIAFRTL